MTLTRLPRLPVSALRSPLQSVDTPRSSIRSQRQLRYSESWVTRSSQTLQGVDHVRISEFSLADRLRHHELVILSFYVSEFSPIRTDHMCELTNLDVFDMVDDVALRGSPGWSIPHNEFIDESSYRC